MDKAQKQSDSNTMFVHHHQNPLESTTFYCFCSGLQSMNSVDDKQPEPKEVAEMRTVGSVTSKVYGTYLRSGGNWCVILTTLLLFILTQALASACDYWITYW
jgi:hypothetical protein